MRYYCSLALAILAGIALGAVGIKGCRLNQRDRKLTSSLTSLRLMTQRLSKRSSLRHRDQLLSLEGSS